MIGATWGSPAGLTREWADAISGISRVPMSVSEVRHYLRDLSERLVAALTGSSVATQAAAEVGVRLVAGGFTGAHSLSATFDVLGRALPAATDGGRVAAYGRIIELLGAVAAGYTQALRNQVFGEKDEFTRVLSQAWQDVESGSAG